MVGGVPIVCKAARRLVSGHTRPVGADDGWEEKRDPERGKSVGG